MRIEQDCEEVAFVSVGFDHVTTISEHMFVRYVMDSLRHVTICTIFPSGLISRLRRPLPD